MYKALSYYKNLYNQLVNYCNKGSYVIDNSEAERSIRSLTEGRKNYLHFGSEKSARIASFFYTIVETCKQQEINSRDYIVNYLYSQIDGNSNNANLLPVADCK